MYRFGPIVQTSPVGRAVQSSPRLGRLNSAAAGLLPIALVANPVIRLGPVLLTDIAVAIFTVNVLVRVRGQAADRLTRGLVVVILIGAALPPVINGFMFDTQWDGWRSVRLALIPATVLSVLASVGNPGLFLSRFRRSFHWSVAAASIYAIYQVLADDTVRRAAGFYSVGRDTGTDLTRLGFNEFGAICAIAVISTLLLRQESTSLGFWTRYLLPGACLLGLVASGSRSASVALVGALLVIAAPRILMPNSEVRSRSVRDILGLSLSVISVAAIFATTRAGTVFSQRLRETIVSGSHASDSAIARFDLWRDGWDLASSDPAHLLFGWGDGIWTRGFYGATTDSFYLDRVVTHGILGAILLVGPLLVAAYYLAAVRSSRSPRSNSELFEHAELGFGTLIVALIVSATGNVLADPSLGILTVVLSMLALASVRGQWRRAHAT